MQDKGFDLYFVDEIFKNEKGLQDYFIGVESMETLFHASDDCNAMKMFEQSAALGFPPAMVELWLYYSSPFFHEHPSKEELYWKSRVQEQQKWFDEVSTSFKNLRLKVTIGRAFTDGVLIQNPEFGVKLVEEAATAGYARGQVSFAIIHERGRGVQASSKKARHYFELAARNGKGNARAQYKLANYYQQGVGSPSDQNQAEYWQQKSAEQQFVWGEICYGELLITKGLVEEGMAFLEKGAAQGLQ